MLSTSKSNKDSHLSKNFHKPWAHTFIINEQTQSSNVSKTLGSFSAKRGINLPQEYSQAFTSGAELNAQVGPDVICFYFLWNGF